MQQHKPPAEVAPRGAWYRQPVLWLGAAILVASLAGCVWMIVLGQRYADVPLEGEQPHTLLNMPVHGAAAAPSGTQARRPGTEAAGHKDALAPSHATEPTQ